MATAARIGSYKIAGGRLWQWRSSSGNVPLKEWLTGAAQLQECPGTFEERGLKFGSAADSVVISDPGGGMEDEDEPNLW